MSTFQPRGCVFVPQSLRLSPDNIEKKCTESYIFPYTLLMQYFCLFEVAMYCSSHLTQQWRSQPLCVFSFFVEFVNSNRCACLVEFKTQRLFFQCWLLVPTWTATRTRGAWTIPEYCTVAAIQDTLVTVRTAHLLIRAKIPGRTCVTKMQTAFTPVQVNNILWVVLTVWMMIFFLHFQPVAQRVRLICHHFLPAVLQ